MLRIFLIMLVAYIVAATAIGLLAVVTGLSFGTQDLVLVALPFVFFVLVVALYRRYVKPEER